MAKARNVAGVRGRARPEEHNRGVGYAVLGQATMVVHFAFLAYLTLGGFLAWRQRWRWTIWLHLAVVAWGISIITIGQECPLTYLENWARRAAGGTDLPGGFINTYLTGVVYPRAYLTEGRWGGGVVVLVSWLRLVWTNVTGHERALPTVVAASRRERVERPGAVHRVGR